MMKNIILFTATIFLFLTGCNKPDLAPVPEQYEKYIFFSQGVDTRSELIGSVSDMIDKSFGVVGFKYSGSWNDAKSAVQPNVFYDDDFNHVSVETVSVTEVGEGAEIGTCSYAPLQGWSPSENYSFFAYYPMDKVTLINADGTSPYSAGVPAIKYTLETMADVMIAVPHIDRRSSADNSDVTFAFSHCLSCLGVNATDASEGGITLNDVTFNISGIKHQSLVLPLDGTAAIASGEALEATDFSLDVGQDGVMISSGGTELSDKLIFIPQDDEIKFTITVNFTRTFDENNKSSSSYTSSEEFNASLVKGKKNLVYLRFMDSSVEVKVNTTSWVIKDPVSDTFN